MEQNTNRMWWTIGAVLLGGILIAGFLFIANNNFTPKISEKMNALIKQTDPDVTHTAYSWSADGTDRFTTTKPNLNLLDGTATFDMNPNSSNNSVSTITKTKISGITNTVMDVKTSGNAFAVGLYRLNAYNITAGQTITISFIAKSLNDTKVLVGFENFPNGQKMFTITPNWKIYTYTFTATTSRTPNFMIYGWDMVAGQHFQVYNPKAEEGTIATPYMPSASEVKPSDQPKYIGTYTDKNKTASQEPSKYIWKLNPDYHE